MKNPNVAIVITCHNKESTIGEAIKSAIAQSYSNRAIVVIDDGSDDKSWGVIKDFVKKKDRYESNIIVGTTEEKISICVIKNDLKKGLGFCKNLAVNSIFSTTDAFLFLEGDDILYPEKLKKCVDIWTTDVEAIGIVYSNQLIENQIEGYDAVFHTRPFCRSTLESEDYVEPNYFISKKALFVSGKFEENILFTDYDMHLRVSEKMVFIHIPEVLSTHRITPYGLTSSTKAIDRQKSYEATVKKALARRR